MARHIYLIVKLFHKFPLQKNKLITYNLQEKSDENFKLNLNENLKYVFKILNLFNYL